MPKIHVYVTDVVEGEAITSPITSFDVDTQTLRELGVHSVERVINNSIRASRSSRDVDAWLVRDDWEVWKSLVTGLTNALRNSVFQMMDGKTWPRK